MQPCLKKANDDSNCVMAGLARCCSAIESSRQLAMTSSGGKISSLYPTRCYLFYVWLLLCGKLTCPCSFIGIPCQVSLALLPVLCPMLPCGHFLLPLQLIVTCCGRNFSTLYPLRCYLCYVPYYHVVFFAAPVAYSDMQQWKFLALCIPHTATCIMSHVTMQSFVAALVAYSDMQRQKFQHFVSLTQLPFCYCHVVIFLLPQQPYWL